MPTKKQNNNGLKIFAGFAALSILVGVGIKYFNTSKAVERFTYRIGKLRIKKQGNWINYLLNGLICTVDIYIQNPSDTTITFQQLVTDIYIDDKRLTRIDIRDPKPISARDETAISTEFKLNLNNLSSSLVDIVKSFLSKDDTAINKNATLKGYIQASDIRLPIDEQIPITRS